MKLIQLAFVFSLFSSSFTTANGLRSTNRQNDENPRLLLISFDGFREKYLYDHHLENFEKFIESGVFATIKPSFATLTFPNHYTIATGLTPEHHGIVANAMYDKFMNETFNVACCDTDNRWWQQNPNVMPIWIANQLAGNNRRSGTVPFVGSLSPICGYHIFKTLPFDSNRPFKESIDTMINWFTDPDEPTNFIAIYLNQPDKTGHEYGPESPEIKNTLKECDELLGYIEGQMKENGIWENTNFIVATDHGMTTVDKMERAIILENYIDLSQCIVAGSGALANIFSPDINTVISIQKNLSNIPHYKAYFRDNVPAEYFYSKNIRIGDVVLMADVGYLIFQTEAQRNASTLRGMHGYNNSDPEMLGIFMARGPAIATNKQDSNLTINTIDIYPLMTEILQIPRRPVDGSYETIQKFLKPK